MNNNFAIIKASRRAKKNSLEFYVICIALPEIITKYSEILMAISLYYSLSSSFAFLHYRIVDGDQAATFLDSQDKWLAMCDLCYGKDQDKCVLYA